MSKKHVFALRGHVEAICKVNMKNAIFLKLLENDLLRMQSRVELAKVVRTGSINTDTHDQLRQKQHFPTVLRFRRKSDLQLWKSAVSHKLLVLANISLYMIHKHPGFYSACVRVDFAICQAIFGLSPVTALDSDLSEHLRKIDVRKNSTLLKFRINARIRSYGLNNHIRTGFGMCT